MEEIDVIALLENPIIEELKDHPHWKTYDNQMSHFVDDLFGIRQGYSENGNKNGEISPAIAGKSSFKAYLNSTNTEFQDYLGTKVGQIHFHKIALSRLESIASHDRIISNMTQKPYFLYEDRRIPDSYFRENGIEFGFPNNFGSSDQETDKSIKYLCQQAKGLFDCASGYSPKTIKVVYDDATFADYLNETNM